MSNPYANMVQDRLGNRFVERSDSCYEEVLRHALEMRAKPSLVYGLQGMGKTCMAWKLKSDIEKRADYKVLYVDAHSLGRREDAALKLFAKMACFIQPQFKINGCEKCSLEEFEVVLLDAKQKNDGLKFIVIIDSLCHALHNEDRDEFFDKIVSLINSLGNADYADVVHLIFFARRSAEMIQNKTGASYLYDKCRSFPLHPFTKEEVESLSRFSGRDVDIEALWLLSGGWPIHAVNLLEEMNDKDVDEKTAYCQRKDEFQTNYSQVAKFFKGFFEDDLPSDFKKMGVENCLDCLVWRELYNVTLPPTVVSLFQEYGLGDDRLPKSLGNFRIFLISCREVGSLLLELEKLEIDMREFVDKELRICYGKDNWIQDVKISEDENWERCDKTGKKPDIVGTLIGWMKKECKKYPDASTSPLDYAYPDDLLGFMHNIRLHWMGSQSWKGFREVFEGEEMTFLSAMQSFGAVRNPAHHCRRPPKQLLEEFKEAKQFLRRYIH